MSIQREEGALRLMEALSGIDTELLERCGEPSEAMASEEKVTKMSQKGKLYKFARRYGGLCAACICLLIVGTVYFRVGQVSMDSTTEMAKSEEECQSSAAILYSTSNETITEGAGAMGIEAERPETAMPETDGIGSMEDSNTVECAPEAEGFVVSSGENVAEAEKLQGKETVGCMPDERVVLSEQEAREVPILGSYIPAALPKGYTFEEARGTLSEDGQYERISLTWTKGMDYISWSVRLTSDSEAACVDPGALECYDVNLYEIPYGDSVPAEYREVFQNPTFRGEDLSLDIIERRMKSVQDAGDTDTPRGAFSVLYQEEVLVSFSGRGTVEEIWELFQNLTE